MDIISTVGQARGVVKTVIAAVDVYKAIAAGRQKKKSGAKIKGMFKNLTTNATIKFQYNPTNFEFGYKAKFEDSIAPGMGFPNTQFVSGDGMDISLELFHYDNPYTGVIDDTLDFLEKCVPPVSVDKTFIRPPEVLFTYPSFGTCRCVIESFHTNFEWIDQQGNPVQATIQVSLKVVGE